MEKQELALVTGASRGIGAAIAQQLAAKGFNLLLVARDRTALDTVAQAIRSKHAVDVHVLVEDLSDAQAPARILNHCQQQALSISMLVNNAGFGLNGPVEEYTADRYEDMIAVNSTSLVSLTRLFLPMLRSQGKGWVLNVASTAAYQAVPGLAVYAATKAFVLFFSRALHHELRGSGVTVTCLSPGPTDTDWATTAQLRGKAVNTAKKMNMTPDAVARIGLNATFAGKTEVVAGFANKFSVFFVKFLPASWVEKIAHGLYK